MSVSLSIMSVLSMFYVYMSLFLSCYFTNIGEKNTQQYKKCETAAINFWKHLFFMTQPRSKPFSLYIQSIPTEEVHKNPFHKMIDYGSPHHSLPLYSVSNIFHSIARVTDDDLRTDLTVFTRNNYQFSIYRTFVLSGRCPVLRPTVPDRRRCLTVETNKMNNYKPSSAGVSTGQTNVQSELLSVPEITV